jgi:hypothetical protein
VHNTAPILCPTTLRDDFSLPTLPSSDDDTSQSSLVSDTPSLLSISPETPPQDILVPDPPRRPTPSRLNADWQTFYRDALQPTTVDVTPIHATHEPLPPPLRPAPNLPCGDHLHPATSHFRLWSNNLNGLSAHNDFTTLHELLANLTDHNISAFAFQETNLDFTQHDIRSRILSIFKEHYGSAKLVTSTLCIKAPTPWKPGGVLLAIVGPWSHAVVDTSTDAMGRWAIATLTGRNGSLFTLGSLYNCVKTNIWNAGPSTAFAQQWQLLRLAGVANPSPRQQCIDDFTHAMAIRVSNKESILITGDLNEALGLDLNLMTSACASLDIYDVMDAMHGDSIAISTYARGSTRLDHTLASHSL